MCAARATSQCQGLAVGSFGSGLLTATSQKATQILVGLAGTLCYVPCLQQFLARLLDLALLAVEVCSRLVHLWIHRRRNERPGENFLCLRQLSGLLVSPADGQQS